MGNMKIEGVERIGAEGAKMLARVGIEDSARLLELAGTRPGRKELAGKTGISESRLLAWVNMLDLCRLNGMGLEFAELLEAAGVDTVRELAKQNSANLAIACASVNGARKIAQSVPRVSVIREWIEQAKSLTPRVEP